MSGGLNESVNTSTRSEEMKEFGMKLRIVSIAAIALIVGINPRS